MAFHARGPLWGEEITDSPYREWCLGSNRVPGILAAMAKMYGVDLPDPDDEANIVPLDDAVLYTSVVTNWIVVRSNQSGDHTLVFRDAMLYMDPNTWNADYDGRYLRVALPEGWDDIIAELQKRRNVATRNYYPYEGDSLDGLIAENIIRGVD